MPGWADLGTLMAQQWSVEGAGLVVHVGSCSNRSKVLQSNMSAPCERQVIYGDWFAT